MTEPAQYSPHLGCAASAQRRDDPQAASAPPAGRWLLIEYREAWPRMGLDVLGDLADELGALSARTGTRPVLIRRHGRLERGTPRRWGLADTRPGRESMRWGELSADAHLFDVLTADDPGVVGREPVYLVCAHGRHDACCAVRGRPVTAALAAAYPDRTWECSHVGGCRFAANLVLLPHGLLYGHVSTQAAVGLAERYDEGVVVPEVLRGRTALSPQVQAAQGFARSAGASSGVDALRPLGVRRSAADTWVVTLADEPDPVEVTLRMRMRPVDGAMTCAVAPPGRMRVFDLVGVSRRPR